MAAMLESQLGEHWAGLTVDYEVDLKVGWKAALKVDYLDESAVDLWVDEMACVTVGS